MLGFFFFFKLQAPDKTIKWNVQVFYCQHLTFYPWQLFCFSHTTPCSFQLILRLDLFIFTFAAGGVTCSVHSQHWREQWPVISSSQLSRLICLMATDTSCCLQVIAGLSSSGFRMHRGPEGHLLLYSSSYIEPRPLSLWQTQHCWDEPCGVSPALPDSLRYMHHQLSALAGTHISEGPKNYFRQGHQKSPWRMDKESPIFLV